MTIPPFPKGKGLLVTFNMKRITPLVRTLKIYIDKLKGYPTVSQGADRQVVEMAKNNIGNLTSLNSHDVSNNLQGLFSAVDLAI